MQSRPQYWKTNPGSKMRAWVMLSLFYFTSFEFQFLNTIDYHILTWPLIDRLIQNATCRSVQVANVYPAAECRDLMIGRDGHVANRYKGAISAQDCNPYTALSIDLDHGAGDLFHELELQCIAT